VEIDPTLLHKYATGGNQESANTAAFFRGPFSDNALVGVKPNIDTFLEAIQVSLAVMDNVETEVVTNSSNCTISTVGNSLSFPSLSDSLNDVTNKIQKKSDINSTAWSMCSSAVGNKGDNCTRLTSNLTYDLKIVKEKVFNKDLFLDNDYMIIDVKEHDGVRLTMSNPVDSLTNFVQNLCKNQKCQESV